MVANLLSSVTFPDRNDRIKSQQLKVATQSNLALCYLKLGDYLQCKSYCDSALALDAKNEKCLFRRGQTQLAFNNFEQAINDFQSVIKINPSNLAAKQQIEHCQQRIKQQEIKQKESYKSFFSDTSRPSLFDLDEKV
jgi:tetratricopeptide (TPR) repeat protein